MTQSTAAERPTSDNRAHDADRRKAEDEAREENVSKPGGFANDPDDPTNPNEVIERHRRKVRP